MDLGVKDRHLLTYIVPDPSLRAARSEGWLWLPRHWLHSLLWMLSGSFWTIVTDYWKQGSHRRTEGEVWYRAIFHPHMLTRLKYSCHWAESTMPRPFAACDLFKWACCLLGECSTTLQRIWVPEDWCECLAISKLSPCGWLHQCLLLHQIMTY